MVSSQIIYHRSMRLKKRIAITGDDTFFGQCSTIKYPRIQMCLKALDPDIAYVIPVPGVVLKTFALLAAMNIPFIIVLPKKGWEKNFCKSDKTFLRRCTREANSVTYLSTEVCSPLRFDQDYREASEYLMTTCNLFLSLHNGTPKEKFSSIMDNIDRSDPDMHVIINCKA